MVVHRVVRRVLSSPIPPDVIGHLGESFVSGGISAVAGSFSELLWRLGNILVGGRKYHPPDTSRRSEPVTIIGEIGRSGLGIIIISPRG